MNTEKITYRSRMKDLFGRHEEKMYDYFQVGRKFWDFHHGKWELITITYKRSNYFFYTINEETKEYCIPCDCVMAICLVPETIYTSELPYNSSHENYDFDDYHGAIKINIVK